MPRLKVGLKSRPRFDLGAGECRSHLTDRDLVDRLPTPYLRCAVRLRLSTTTVSLLAWYIDRDVLQFSRKVSAWLIEASAFLFTALTDLRRGAQILWS